MWLSKAITFVVGVFLVWIVSSEDNNEPGTLVLLGLGFIFIFMAFPRSRANSALDANPAEDGKSTIEGKSPSLIKVILSVFYYLIILLLGSPYFVYLVIKLVKSKRN